MLREPYIDTASIPLHCGVYREDGVRWQGNMARLQVLWCLLKISPLQEIEPKVLHMPGKDSTKLCLQLFLGKLCKLY